ncbi:MAG: trigger factor [Acidimicrobiales bacterium]
MRTTAEPVEGNKIRLSVEIDEPEIDKALDETVRTLSRQARVPGFRPGHVPRQVLEARMGGAAALRAEALREALPDFYAKAVAETDLDPIAPPEIDITDGEEQGPVAFDAVVEVRPRVGIPGYAGLQVTVGSPRVTDAEVDAQVDVVRETDAELVDVSRPALDGDNVTVDLHGTAPGGESVADLEDLLYEVGSGRVVAGLDAQLRGAKVGDVLAFEAAAGEPAGSVSFRVLVKEVKEKRLPEPTDEWAAESSEFATVDELRDDIRSRLARVKALQATVARREGALAALAGLVDDDEVPEVLVEEELRERVQSLSHRLEEQRIGLDQFLEATGRTGDQLVAQVREDARSAVKADLALRALAEAEALEVTDDELATELEAMADRMNMEADALRRQLDRAGRTAAVRSEQRKAKALTWLLDHVAMVDADGNEITADELESETVDQGAEGTGAAAGDVGGGSGGAEAETEGAQG